MTKKKESLSTEERLKNALVPDWEQPYKVPENWVWTKVNAVAEIVMGQSPNGADTTEQISEYGLIGGAADMGELNPKISRYTVSPTKLSQKNDVILSIRATLGRPIFSDGIYCLGRGVSAIRSKKLSKEFLRYFYLNFEQYLYDVATGTTFTQVGSEQLKSMKIPLPPLAEQQRIVNRIESLFSKLDDAKEKAQAALGSFENRKAAILHEAFSGKLTESWRKENGVSLENWESKRLGEITNIKSSKRIYKEEYVESGVPFFRSSEVVELNDTGNTIPTFFISRERYEEIKNQYGVPKIGDLLVTSVGTIGKTWLVDNREFYYKDGNLTQIEKSDNIIMEFVQYYIKSQDFRTQVKDTVSGSAYDALTIIKFKNIVITLPSISEQTEIVRILNSILAKEQVAKELVSVIEKIDLMKKAILARAFRGKLGTNDPNEESAMELLEQILEVKG